MEKLRLYGVLSFMILAFSLTGQKSMSYKVFVPSNDYKQFGYQIQAGSSFTTGLKDSRITDMSIGNVTSYRVSVGAQGSSGLHFAAGGFYVFEKGLFRVVDFSLGFSQIKGVENLRAERLNGGDLSFPEIITSTGNYKFNTFEFHFGAKMVHTQNKRSFISHGPGLLVQESLSGKSEYPIPHLSLNNQIEEKWSSLGLTYSLSYGFRISSIAFVDLFVRTKFVDFSNQSIFDTSREVFNSRYRNHVCGARILFMTKREGRSCPALSSNNEGSGRFSRQKKKRRNYAW